MAVIFRAHLGSVPRPPVPERTYVKVPFDHMDHNLGEGFDPAGAWFKPSRAGFYSVNACVWFGSIATGITVVTAIYKNGKPYAQVAMATAATINCGAALSDVVKLEVGDCLEVYGVHDSTAPRQVLPGASETYFSGFLIGRA